MSDFDPRGFRLMIRGLQDLDPAIIDGKEYTGTFFAALLAMDPDQLESEAARSPQLMAELGALAHRAYRAKEEADLAMRVWRDTEVFQVTNSLDDAESAGFDCAHSDHDSKRKLPSVTAAEKWVRTRPRYVELYRAVHRAEESWAVAHTALDAAKARVRALGSFSTARQSDPSYDRSRRGGTSVSYEGGTEESGHDIEELASAAPRSPVPPRNDAPPPPPPRRTTR